jgi:hypothetical protein
VNYWRRPVPGRDCHGQSSVDRCRNLGGLEDGIFARDDGGGE